ncbi:MAG: hypothetical protein CME68_09225 [Halobacteriovoraceae bacterium]|nr:hypothetical protein [Halobacteriovoraceae bacterium]|tara:strand:- start:65 stop:928 length:864 start_codon:yes stop_codon:yes gene_type:complete
MFKTKYLERCDIKLAYQVFGEGNTEDLIFVPGIVSHIEHCHKFPGFTKFIEKLSKHYRVLLFDKRGSGLSKRIDHAPSLEERLSDIDFMMEENSSEKAILLGYSEGAQVSALYAASNPSKVSKMILVSGLPHSSKLEKLWWMPKLFKYLILKRRVDKTVRDWGKGFFMEKSLPKEFFKVMPTGFHEELSRFETDAIAPESLKKLLYKSGRHDVTPFLKNVKTPTLVVHSKDDRIVPYYLGKKLNEFIDGSQFLSIDGLGHSFFYDPKSLIITSFLAFLSNPKKVNSP